MQGSCSTESSLCSAFPSTPRSTARAAAPQRSTEIQQFPFCAHKQHSYFWLPPASHPFCRVPRKLGLHPWAACFERLRELSQLGRPGHIPNSSKGCRITAGSAPKLDITFLKPLLALPEDGTRFLSQFSEGSTHQGGLRSVFAQMGRSQQAGSESVPKELRKTQRCDSKKLWWKKGQGTPICPGILRWKINEPGPGNCIP